MEDTKFLLSESFNWPKDKIGIYSIRSLASSKKYIGLTMHRNGFYGRWEDHRDDLRRKDHDNIFLQNSYNKHGELDFYMEILLSFEHGEISRPELEKLEWEYIEKMESLYFQSGWNIDTHDRFNKRKVDYRPSRKKIEKKFEFISPVGDTVSGTNLTKFCRENNLSAPNMNKVLHGKQHSCGGYKSTNKNFHVPEKTKYSLISPNGELFEFRDAPEFAGDHNLHLSNLYSTLNYKNQQCQGWYVPDVLLKMDCKIDHPARTHLILNVKECKIHQFKSIKKFSEKYKLPTGKIIRLVNPDNKEGNIIFGEWAKKDCKIRAVLFQGIIHKFLWARDVSKKINIRNDIINRVCKESSSYKDILFNANPYPLELTIEDF